MKFQWTCLKKESGKSRFHRNTAIRNSTCDPHKVSGLMGKVNASSKKTRKEAMPMPKITERERVSIPGRDFPPPRICSSPNPTKKLRVSSAKVKIACMLFSYWDVMYWITWFRSVIIGEGLPKAFRTSW